MKKTILSVLFAAATLGANAQMYIGGTLGFESSKNKGATAVYNFDLLPDFGYKLDDAWSLGIELGYQHCGNMSDEMIILEEKAERIKGNRFKIAPYARFTFLTIGDFHGFIDGKISFATTGLKTVINNGSTTTTQDYNNNINAFSISLEPGVVFDATKNVTLVAKMSNLLGFTHRWCGDATNNSFGLGVNTLGISLGAYYNF